jgi:hypothetical protein
MENITKKIVVTFLFEHVNPNIDSTLKWIQVMILFEEPEVEIITKYQ